MNDCYRYKDYLPQYIIPTDFSEFWWESIDSDLKVEPSLELRPLAYPLPQVELFEARLIAGDGSTLRGHYLRPKHRSNLPALVRFHGYSSNRGQVSELLLWALQGYAVLAMDIRGQCGQSPDGRRYPQGQFAGWMTLGLNSPYHYYYRQVYLDAFRTLLALAKQPEVNRRNLGLFGKSQGGGIALALGGLVARAKDVRAEVFAGCADLEVKAISASIPFLCDFPVAYSQAQDGPLLELSQYFRLYDPEQRTAEQVFHCLSYFDAASFAPWVESSVLLSVGLQDNVCPPQTVFGVYNLIPGPKELVVYPDFGHETIEPFTDRQIAFFAAKLLDYSP